MALLIGLALAQVRVLHDEDSTIATAALFVITTGYHVSDQRSIDLLPDRLFNTAIGVALALLVDMARQLREPVASQEHQDWIEGTRSIDTDIHHAWSLVRTARESRSWNPRRRRRPGEHVEDYPQILQRLEGGVSQTRSICRHVRESSREAQEWDLRFRDRFIPLLAAVRCADR